MSEREIRLQPNTTQIPNYLIDKVMPRISPAAFKVLLVIARQTYGWHKDKEWIAYSQFIDKTGLHRETVSNGLKELKELKIIEITNATGEVLNDDSLSGRRQLYYRIKVGKTDYINDDKSENPTFKSRKIEHTKETNTKVLSKDNSSVAKKQPSCPLLNGSILKAKYPNGHTECIEYYLSVEERRGNKFINQPKQFNCIHKILRAGYGFNEMNKVFPKIENKYGKGNWDFGTLASWLEKGANNG